MMLTYDAHIRAYGLALFAGSKTGFARSMVEFREQLAAGFAFAGQQQRARAAALLADVIRNGT
jgi:hypothetical protein